MKNIKYKGVEIDLFVQYVKFYGSSLPIPGSEHRNQNKKR